MRKNAKKTAPKKDAPKKVGKDAPAAEAATVDVAAEREASRARTGAPTAEAAPLAARAPSPIRTDVRLGASKYSGKVLVRLVEGNPRRPGSHGARAYDLLPAGLGATVRYEEFREKVERDPTIRGGLNHIAYDLEKGFVAIVAAEEAEAFAKKVRKGSK